jgi:hypothetical protein
VGSAWHAAVGRGGGPGEAPLAAIIRDIFGPPASRPRPTQPCPWQLSLPALTLAEAAYQERALPSDHLDAARLAVLSDALEEAGCMDEAILSHLRSPGPHVRGCWALDLVLGQQ